MATTIRVMTIDDYEQAYALWGRTEGVVLTQTDSREWIERYLERNPGMSFVAVDEERVVGTVLCGSDGRRGYLTHLAVDPEYRRRGIARALVEKTVDAMRTEGLPGCNLFILDSNTAGRAFWESQGWAVPDTWNVMNRRFE